MALITKTLGMYFEPSLIGQDIAIDVAHNPDNGAASKIVNLNGCEGKPLCVHWLSGQLTALRPLMAKGLTTFQPNILRISQITNKARRTDVC